MQEPPLFAVIMAGGSGTRFWPASRSTKPKQYLRIGGEEPLLKETWNRLEGLVPAERVLVVTTSDQVEEVRGALPDLPELNILAEPEARNTAPCVALAAFEIKRRAQDSVQVVLPADHVIRPRERFQATIRAAAKEANQLGTLITCGIRPTYAATGFGYIEVGAPTREVDGLEVRRVQRFVEKPPLERAREFLEHGGFLWNAGIFVWHTDAICRAVEEHMPETHAALSRVARGADLRELYAALPSRSIDVAVLERARNVRVLPIDYFWSDVGTWNAIGEVQAAEPDGNVRSGGTELVAEDARGCVVHGDEGEVIALVGVQDLIVVHSGNATLVCHRDRAQDVKKIVERLQRGDGGFT
jgi:mannose-1-phosphate guanylyltransferase